MRWLLILLVSFITLGVASLIWLRSHESKLPDLLPETPAASTSVPLVEMQPPVVTTRRFDPAAPPPDMPPLHAGEQAECESNFTSAALVSGRSRGAGMSTAVLTITGVKVKLQLLVTIWVPEGVTQKVMEHEEGHRQISESYYATADQFARRIAASYIGKQLTVTGSDLQAEANKALQQTGAEITAEYGRQLDADAAQLHYDAITDHALNDVSAADAVAQVLKERPAELQSTGLH